jgi:hypothetical protein
MDERERGLKIDQTALYFLLTQSIAMYCTVLYCSVTYLWRPCHVIMYDRLYLGNVQTTGSHIYTERRGRGGERGTERGRKRAREREEEGQREGERGIERGRKRDRVCEEEGQREGGEGWMDGWMEREGAGGRKRRVRVRRKSARTMYRQIFSERRSHSKKRRDNLVLYYTGHAGYTGRTGGY